MMREKERKPLMLCRFGSHLYGTDTPSSDTDFKGVFLPSSREVILQKVPKSVHSSTGAAGEKNAPGDVDREVYSLHYFLKLAGEGQTVAIDMLHCPGEMLLETSEEWEFIRTQRSLFYTKDMKAFVGYCRTQAAKYGVRGSRLADCRRVVEFLAQAEGERLADVWEQLPEGEHIRKFEEATASQADKRIFEVCARKVPATATLSYAHSVFVKYYESYGARAQLAARSEGIDWKAISHAFRAGFQLREILLTGDLVFPLREREFLKKVKAGAFHYQNDGIAQQLEDLVDEAFALSAASALPEKVDMGFWDEFVVSLYAEGKPWYLPGLA